MNLDTFVALSAVLVGTGLAGALAVQDSPLRPIRWVSAAIFCAVIWSFCDLSASLSASAEVAAFWLRAITVPAMALGPITLLGLATLRPRLASRLRMLAALSSLAGIGIVSASLMTSAFISEVLPTATGGWTYRFGSGAPLMLVQEAWPFLAALAILSNAPERGATPISGELPLSVIAAGIGLPFIVVSVTDVALPGLGVPSPRLGAASISLFAGGIWLASIRRPESRVTSRGFARSILEVLPQGVALLGRDGTLRSANESLAGLVGCRTAALVGESIELRLDLSLPELLDEPVGRETSLRTANGGTLPVAISCSRVRDLRGGVIGLVLVIRDIGEVVGLRRQLVAAGRLAAAGELAAEIAHEVSNPTAFVQSNLNLLSSHCDEIEGWMQKQEAESFQDSSQLGSSRQQIDEALKNVSRVAAVVREVRDFAHAGTCGAGMIDVTALIESALELARLPRGVRAHVDCHLEELPALHGSGQDLKLVFLSLLRRAFENAGGSGCVRVVSRAREGTVEVSVEDDGKRAKRGELPLHVFHPSFDSATRHAGEPIDLAVVEEIIRQHEGRLSIDALDSGGTRACVWLPTESPDDPLCEDGWDET